MHRFEELIDPVLSPELLVSQDEERNPEDRVAVRVPQHVDPFLANRRVPARVAQRDRIEPEPGPDRSDGGHVRHVATLFPARPPHRPEELPVASAPARVEIRHVRQLPARALPVDRPDRAIAELGPDPFDVLQDVELARLAHRPVEELPAARGQLGQRLRLRLPVGQVLEREPVMREPRLDLARADPGVRAAEGEVEPRPGGLHRVPRPSASRTGTSSGTSFMTPRCGIWA